MGVRGILEEELSGPRVIMYTICRLALSLDTWRMVVMPIEIEWFSYRLCKKLEIEGYSESQQEKVQQ